MNLIDTTHWEIIPNASHNAYPEGSLQKYLLICPKGEKFLFKESWSRSRQTYSDEVKTQYWSEIIAYLIADMMQISVAKVHIAVNYSNDVKFKIGSLCKWIDHFDKGSFALNSHFNYGYERGDDKKHNLHDNLLVMYCPEYWMKMMIFDALIGNTDRHQENWGLVKRETPSPLFDNGISLGWRIPEEKFNVNTIEKQWKKFKHKIKIYQNDPQNAHTKEIIDYFINLNYSYKSKMQYFINLFDITILKQYKAQLCKMQGIPCDYLLTTNRFDFITEFTEYRKHKILEIIRDGGK